MTQTFIPKHEAPCPDALERLQDLVQASRRLLVMTGAGISTESGIPDYRSEDVGLYARSKNRPIQYKDFIKSDSKRQRYWARNFVGWPKFGFHSPNRNHEILSSWEALGKIHWLITQNVDALHYKAGSKKVTELHGSSHRVQCLSCDAVIPRQKLQKTFKLLNPDFDVEAVEFAPDGDVQLTDEQVQDFVVPPCASCGGVLKPEIIFFGDNVPQTTKDFCFKKLEGSDLFLVLGSSLFVYSGYRFALKAHELGIPVGISNIGPTRADHLAEVRVGGLCSEVLSRIDGALQ